MLAALMGGSFMKIRITPLAAALGLAAGMLASSAAFTDTIKFAVAGPFTGALTQYGEMVKQGVDTAVEQINAKGGVLGKQIEVVVMDDACEPKQGPVVANRVVNEGIGYVVGHVCSGATIAATDIYNNEGVIMISPSATAPAVTEGKNYETISALSVVMTNKVPPQLKSSLNKLNPKKSLFCMISSRMAKGLPPPLKTI